MGQFLISEIMPVASNPCTKAGCEAACCQGMILNITLGEAALIIPAATNYVVFLSENALYKSTSFLGFYSKYAALDRFGGVIDPLEIFRRTGEKGNTKALVLLGGKCPNLDPQNNCSIYEQRPSACRNFNFGSRECVNKRKEQINHT